IFSISGTVNANTSCLTSNGSIDVNIVPAGIYTYSWLNGSAVPDLQNLTPGIYIVTVSDQFGCSSMQSFVVDDSTSNPIITQSITPDTCGQGNGSIDISILSTGSMNFHWS